MWVRRQIAALTLITAQLLQGVLPASGALCTSSGMSESARIVLEHLSEQHSERSGARSGFDSSHGPNAHSAATHEPVGASHASQSHAGESHESNRQKSEQHGSSTHTPASCPMAMMCAISGVVIRAESVPELDRTIDAPRTANNDDWPSSLDITPEPPPPRR